MNSSDGRFPDLKKSARVNERDRTGNGGIVRVLPDDPKYVLRAAEFTLLHRYKKHRPGVGIFVDRVLIQHLTREEAISLADQLVDAAEARWADPRATKSSRRGSADD